MRSSETDGHHGIIALSSRPMSRSLPNLLPARHNLVHAYVSSQIIGGRGLPGFGAPRFLAGEFMLASRRIFCSRPRARLVFAPFAKPVKSNRNLGPYIEQ